MEIPFHCRVEEDRKRRHSSGTRSGWRWPGRVRRRGPWGAGCDRLLLLWVFVFCETAIERSVVTRSRVRHLRAPKRSVLDGPKGVTSPLLDIFTIMDVKVVSPPTFVIAWPGSIRGSVGRRGENHLQGVGSSQIKRAGRAKIVSFLSRNVKGEQVPGCSRVCTCSSVFLWTPFGCKAKNWQIATSDG